MNHNWKTRLPELPGAALTIFTGITLLLAGLRPEWDDVTRSLLFLLLLFSPLLLGGGANLRRTVLAGGLFFAFALLSIRHPVSRRLLDLLFPDVLIPLLTLAFEIFLVTTLAQKMLFSRKNVVPVFGCVLAYMLIGVAFADSYMLIEEYIGSSFLHDAKPFVPTLGDMLYFSFTTLTTCGYGDIVPATGVTKMLAALEMVTGVMFVALFIGRVISLPRGEQRP